MPAIKLFPGQLATCCQLLLDLESARILENNSYIHWKLDLNRTEFSKSVSIDQSRL